MRFTLALGVCAVFISALPAMAFPIASQITVYKSERKMVLLDENGDVLKKYKIALGAKPRGHKFQEGDERTPEGVYYIAGRNPESKYHLSLRISYPDKDDKELAAERGVAPGGDIMIHGMPNRSNWFGKLFRRFYSKWTDGCIAVRDKEMDEIWQLVPDGIPIEIRP